MTCSIIKILRYTHYIDMIALELLYGFTLISGSFSSFTVRICRYYMASIWYMPSLLYIKMSSTIR